LLTVFHDEELQSTGYSFESDDDPMHYSFHLIFINYYFVYIVGSLIVYLDYACWMVSYLLVFLKF
jgi:hypothetical protein